MGTEVDPNINPLIWTAIEKKRLLRFRYKNRERIVEPHDYGIHKGLIKLWVPSGRIEQPETAKLAMGRARSDLGSPTAGPDVSWRPSHQIRQTPEMGQAVHQSQTAG